MTYNPTTLFGPDGPEEAGTTIVKIEPPFQSHSKTSVEAAKEVLPISARLRRQVLEYLQARSRTGATDDEMQVNLNIQGSTQRPRRVELLKAGLIADSGNTRQTRSGRQATVWTAVV